MLSGCTAFHMVLPPLSLGFNSYDTSFSFSTWLNKSFCILGCCTGSSVRVMWNLLLLPCRQAEEEGVPFEGTSSLLIFSSCQCPTAWITWLENSSGTKISSSGSSGNGPQSPPKAMLSGNRFIPAQGLKGDFCIADHGAWEY